MFNITLNSKLSTFLTIGPYLLIAKVAISRKLYIFFPFFFFSLNFLFHFEMTPSYFNRIPFLLLTYTFNLIFQRQTNIRNLFLRVFSKVLLSFLFHSLNPEKERSSLSLTRHEENRIILFCFL